MGGLFGSKKPAAPTGPLPAFTLDARLPNPAILTRGNALPLRLILNNQAQNAPPLIMWSLHIELIAHTYLRAGNMWREEPQSLMLLSRERLGIPIESIGKAAAGEVVVDDSLWRGLIVPMHLAPTFETCNIRRRYELEVRVGLGHGPFNPASVSCAQILMHWRLQF